jgi:hypothetical protein
MLPPGRKTGAAFSIMTRAECARNNLGAAKGWFQSVRKEERKHVLAACKQAGTDLNP